MAQRMNLLGEPGVRLSEGPGRPIPSRADVYEAYGRAMGMFLVLVIVTAAVLVSRYESRDEFTGAHGPFPAAFGNGAPVAPEHVVRRTTDEEAWAHGLSLRWTGFGVTAVNLRTGKEYWRYERHDHNGVMNSVEASERTVVTGDNAGRLVGIDLRTGKSLWRTELREDGYRAVALAGGQAVTDSRGTVRAFDERDGRSLWTAKMPESCLDLLVYSVHPLADRLSAVQVFCNLSDPDVDDYNLLLGVDNRTGKVLWQRRTVDPKLTVWSGGPTLVAPKSDRSPAVQLLDVNRRGSAPRATLHLREEEEGEEAVAAGSGIALTGTDTRADGSGYAHTLLRAYDIRDGRFSWELRAPAGRHYGLPEIADGRVYVVRQPLFTDADAGHKFHADLLVLDAATGRLLHTLRLPATTAPDDPDDYFDVLDVLDTGDGTVTVGWQSGDGHLLIATD